MPTCRFFLFRISFTLPTVSLQFVLLRHTMQGQRLGRADPRGSSGGETLPFARAKAPEHRTSAGVLTLSSMFQSSCVDVCSNLQGCTPASYRPGLKVKSLEGFP